MKKGSRNDASTDEQAVLEVKNLSTYYFKEDSTVKAVQDVSFKVKAGKMTAIVGESGCGKTATALSILRLIPSPPGKIVSGEILFQGQDLLTLSAEELRKVRGNQIGMVFQEPMTSLNPVLTIGRQLTETIVEHQRLSRREAAQKACKLLEQVGISEPESRLNQYPFQLSGGMRQRVMIAIALSCDPQLIIADEPTTALDVTVQAQLLDLMKKLCDELNVALLIITHNLGIVARYAEHVVVMYAGKIVEQGTAVEVFKHAIHPYTKSLMGSVPRLDQPASEKLETIEGHPPDLSQPIEGCAFAPRCVHASKRCRQEKPAFVADADGHGAACWLWDPDVKKG